MKQDLIDKACDKICTKYGHIWMQVIKLSCHYIEVENGRFEKPQKIYLNERQYKALNFYWSVLTRWIFGRPHFKKPKTVWGMKPIVVNGLQEMYTSL